MTVVGELRAFVGALNPQWVLLGVASLAALIAWRSAHLHIRRVQQLELLKFLEQPHVRDARRIVYTKIRERPADDEWWKSKDNECWERAASLVCATYDIVDITAMRKNRRFFET